MPGSTTTRGHLGSCDNVSKRIAFRLRNGVGAPNIPSFAAQWLAYASLYRRFTSALTSGRARLEVDVVRYTFIVMESHHVLLAGLPAHSQKRSFAGLLILVALKDTSDRERALVTISAFLR